MTGGSPISCNLAPLDLLRRWPAGRPVALLHSGRADPRWARYCTLAMPDGAIRFDGSALHRTGHAPVTCSDPFASLQQCIDDEPDVLWLGYLGYDLGRWVEQIPSRAADERPWPILQFERCPGWAVYDTVAQTWSGFGSWADGRALMQIATRQPPNDGLAFDAGPAEPGQRRVAYEAAVTKVLDYIAAGDVFQVNLAQRFTGTFAGNPRGLFHRLAQQSPAWYGAYLEPSTLQPDEPRRALVSISPELFLHCDDTGRVTTRPIKGTLASDRSKQILRDSEKDVAELAMIVDLMRNDLGRVCTVGSVRVPEPRTLETHPTIHHGVATITGQLAPRHSLTDLLRATMPGGSITGAPKIRAMQIIEELEPVRRGPYCGAIGCIHGRSMILNIAIRTLMIEQPNPQRVGRYSFSVGGGIVADSTPAAEYDETLAKAQAMLRGLCPAASAHAASQAQQ